MAIETVSSPKTLQEAFDHNIYSSDGIGLRLGSLFCDSGDCLAPRRILLIFIRHFFCGNCQEYVRRLSAPESPFHPAYQHSSRTALTPATLSRPASHSPPAVIIIGPGEPSLIPSYSDMTQCPFPIYSDPSTQLYKILGMHRTLALGGKAPEYIKHSLFSGALKSAWQIVRRMGNGDAMRGGDWNVNGGEFLFVQQGPAQFSQGSKSASQSRLLNSREPSSTPPPASPPEHGWEMTWCHRMLNSRDHTEIVDLRDHTFLSIPAPKADSRSESPSRPILVKGNSFAHWTVSTKAGIKTYTNDCPGSCPGPDIPKHRGEALSNQSLDRSPSYSKSRGTKRSRSSSAHSRAELKHGRTKSIVARSGSRASGAHHIPDAIYEGDDDSERLQSFTATVVDRTGVLVSTKSRSGRQSAAHPVSEKAISDCPTNPGPSTSSTKPLRRSGKAKSISSLLPSRFKSSSEPSGEDLSQSVLERHLDSAARRPQRTTPTSGSQSKSHARTRTFSFSKTSGKRPGVEMDEKGVMLVDGVEFINLVSIKARVDVGKSGPYKT